MPNILLGRTVYRTIAPFRLSEHNQQLLVRKIIIEILFCNPSPFAGFLPQQLGVVLNNLIDIESSDNHGNWGRSVNINFPN